MKYWLIILFTGITFSLSAKEVAQPVFDNREWAEGWSIQQDPTQRPPPGTVYKEYVLKGETVENWSELVTLQFFPGLQDKTSLENFEQLNKTNLLKVCPNANWKTLSSNDNERVWEWSIKNCTGQPDQSEIAKVVKTKEGIHIFHYATKKENISDATREIWLKNLNSIKIEDKGA
jgi:hypothetical protein